MIIENVIVIGYCVWQQKPIGPILLTSVCANLLTQSLLWVVLQIFFQHYLIALMVAEILILALESFALYFIPANKLRFSEAITLGFLMNGFSFAIGWFLPT